MTNKNLNNSNIPDFYNDYYRLELWTKEEAIALSLSLDPTSEDIPKTCSLTFSIPYNSLNKEYERRMRLLEQAIMLNDETLDVKQSGVYDSRPTTITPSSFICWTKKKGLSFPLELEKLIEQHHKLTNNYIDWKAKYIELEIVHNQYKKEKEKPLHATEREGLLRFLGVMIVACYNPKDKKKDIKISEIKKDYANAAVDEPDDKTIRKYLKAAIKALEG